METMPLKDQDAQRQYQLIWMWRRRLTWILENGPCRWCGSVNNLSVSFRNPAGKTYKVSSIWSRSEESRTALLAECEVLCHECHRKKIATWRAVKAALGLKPARQSETPVQLRK
jgi:5-methylcytosine-specific restriction endonuclease McrA